MGNTDQALDLLEEALEADLWFFPDGLRQDPDLESLQGLSRFERILEVCSKRQAAARKQAKPQRLVLEPTGTGSGRQLPLLIALHGNNSSAEHSSQFWQPAADQGWLVALAQSSQVTGPGRYGWNDREWTEHDIRYHHQSLIEQYDLERESVILAGFSMGGRWAAWMSLNELIPNLGFIAIAPFIPDIQRFVPLLEAAKDRFIRGYVIAGEKDANCYAGTRELVAAMKSHGIPCEFESHADLGHAYPPDFRDSLDRARRFFLN
jgi:pimeloyl-ACP methyl ester carboxylesterase